jgi:FKBP-type peptidyl-prolyl cis-trans isomerase 2
LDTEALEMKQRQQQQQQQQHNQHHNHQHEVKRQGSSQDGESIKIVIDDVDSTAAAIDNNKAQSNEAMEFRTRVVRLRRDPQDRGYQSMQMFRFILLSPLIMLINNHYSHYIPTPSQSFVKYLRII